MRPRLIVRFWQTCGGRKQHWLAYVRWLGRDWLMLDGLVPFVEPGKPAGDA